MQFNLYTLQYILDNMLLLLFKFFVSVLPHLCILSIVQNLSISIILLYQIDFMHTIENNRTLHQIVLLVG